LTCVSRARAAALRAIAQRRLIKSETEYLTIGPLGLQLYIRDAASKAIVICIESQHICAQVRAALRDRPVAPPLNRR
jgi:hypothetical protein